MSVGGVYSLRGLRAADWPSGPLSCGRPVAARRVTMPDLPIPFASTLEDTALPSADAVATAATSLQR